MDSPPELSRQARVDGKIKGMSTSPPNPPLRAGHEAEWAQLNCEEADQLRESNMALSPAQRAAGRSETFSAGGFAAGCVDPELVMPQDEPTGPDLAGVVADARVVGLECVVIGGFSVIYHGHIRATKDSDLLVPDGQEADEAILRFMERADATRCVTAST